MICPTYFIITSIIIIIIIIIIVIIIKFMYVGPTGSICTTQKVHRSCSKAIIHGKVYSAS